MDELELTSGGGALALSTQRARQIGHQAADALQGVCDDSV
jgi:hypothetical protein